MIYVSKIKIRIFAIMIENIHNIILKKKIFSHSFSPSYRKNNSDFFSNTFCDELTKNLLSKEIEFSNIATKKKKIKILHQKIF